MAYGRGGIYMDPSFQMGLAFGDAYGNMWAANAKNRQEKKAANVIDDLMNNGMTNADINAAIQGSYDLSKGAIADPNFTLSRATPDGRSVQENAADEALGLKNGGQYPIANKQEYKFKNLELLQGTDQSGAVPTVTDVQEAVGNQSAWSPGVTAEDIKLALQKQGINKDVIDGVLPEYEKKLKQEASSNLVPAIMDKYKKGDYAGAMQDTLTLRQYDPETASILLSGSVTPRDMYADDKEQRIYERNRVDQLEAEGRKITNAKDLALFNAKLGRIAANWSLEDKVAFAERNPDFAGAVFGGRGNTSSNKSIFDSGAFKAANEQIKTLNEKVALGGELTPDEQQRLAQANALVNGAFSTLFQPTDQQQSNQTAVNLNDYPTAIRFVTEIKEKTAGRIPDVQIAQAFRQEYGLDPNDDSNDFMEKILSDAGIVGKKQEQSTQQPTPQAKPWWDRTERTGLAAMDLDDIKQAITENVRNNPVEYRR